MRKIIIIGFVLCLGIMNVSAQTIKIKEQEVIKKTESLNKAVFITKDGTVLEELLSDKVTYGHSGGKLETKNVMIQHATTDLMTYPGFTVDSVSVAIEGNTAVVRHVIRSKTVNNGIEGTLHLGILLVWVKEKKDWKLLARQAVKL